MSIGFEERKVSKILDFLQNGSQKTRPFEIIVEFN